MAVVYLHVRFLKSEVLQVTSVEQSAMTTSRGVAWGGAGVRVDARPAVNLMWDDPPLESTNKAAKKSRFLVVFFFFS